MDAKVKRDSVEPAGYSGAQAFAMVPEMVHAGVLSDWLQDDEM